MSTPPSHPRPSPRSSLHIRIASPADLGAIEAIEQSSFDHAAERFEAKRIHRLIHSKRSITLVAEMHGKIVGWAAGFRWDRGVEPWGRIYALAVAPAGRGRGVGAQLLREMIDRFCQGGPRRLFLEVRPDNHAALRLYRRFGFVPCRTLPNFYARGRSAERMTRPPTVTRAEK
jgi:ribosomal protein S18 acetylase RimI-like enzyme